MKKEAKKKSFIFNVEWQDVLLDYPSEVRLEVYDAIIEYVATGTLSELKPMAKMAFSFIKKEIDYNAKKYNEMVAKRKEAGMKGVKAKQNKQKVANASKCKQKVTNEADNVYDNDIKKESPNGDKKEADASSCSQTNNDYQKFQDWLTRKAPYCSNIKNFPSQITETEFMKLKEKYTGKQIAETIEQIENRKDLRKRYTNLYRTVLNWAKKEYGS